MYKTMLLLVCTGNISVNGNLSDIDKVIAFGNHRESILYDGAYMPMVDLRQNRFEIDHTFYEKGVAVRYYGIYDYNKNELKLQLLKTFKDYHHEKIVIDAVCTDPMKRNE